MTGVRVKNTTAFKTSLWHIKQTPKLESYYIRPYQDTSSHKPYICSNNFCNSKSLPMITITSSGYKLAMDFSSRKSSSYLSKEHQGRSEAEVSGYRMSFLFGFKRLRRRCTNLWLSRSNASQMSWLLLIRYGQGYHVAKCFG